MTFLVFHHFQQYFSYIVDARFIGGENHQSDASNRQTLLRNIVSSTPRHERDSNSTLAVIVIDCMGSCKSNYNTMPTTTAPIQLVKCQT